jgi:hypothetical protein
MASASANEILRGKRLRHSNQSSRMHKFSVDKFAKPAKRQRIFGCVEKEIAIQDRMVLKVCQWEEKCIMSV